MRGQKGLFPSHTETAWLGVIKWQQSSTCSSSSSSGTLAQEDAEGGTRGMQQKSISPLTLKGNIWHVPTALNVFSVSLQSLDMQEYPSAVIGSEKPLVLMDCVDAGAIFPWCKWKNRNEIIVHGRREPLGWLQPVYHITYHTRVKQEWWRRGERRERETEREGGGEGSALARVCVRVYQCRSI